MSTKKERSLHYRTLVVSWQHALAAESLASELGEDRARQRTSKAATSTRTLSRDENEGKRRERNTRSTRHTVCPHGTGSINWRTDCQGHQGGETRGAGLRARGVWLAHQCSSDGILGEATTSAAEKRPARRPSKGRRILSPFPLFFFSSPGKLVIL